MTDTFATSAAPPWAVTAWLDDTAVYVEIPNRAGPPYVMSFALTEGGLSKALGLMRQVHRELGAKRYTKTDSVTKPFPKFTEGQRQSAQKVLKKLGIT